MTAPILNSLREKHDIRLTLKTTLPEKLLRTRISGDFSVIEEKSDFGMVMHNSFDVDLEESAHAYQLFHSDYEQKVVTEAQVLKKINPDLILANIPYLTIDAAFQAGIPCVAYCSLNWLEIFNHYFKNIIPEASKIKKQIAEAYGRADIFMCPAPSMVMPDLTNILNIGPVAKKNHDELDLFDFISQEKTDEIFKSKLTSKKEMKVVLVTPGGVHTPIPVDSWPEENNITWLCSWPLETSRRDIISIADIDLSFNDVLANCDAVISKPGYGTVTETVCNQVPALYVKRGDWPEEAPLVEWWEANGVVREISKESLYSGNIVEHLHLLWRQDYKPKVIPSGIEDACNIISKYID